jgi:YHS domain-containing protein
VFLTVLGTNDIGNTGVLSVFSRFSIIFVWVLIIYTFFLTNFTHIYARSLLIINADNLICPVTNEEIKEQKFNSVYNGRRYWISSYKALREFKEAPKKYIASDGSIIVQKKK